MASASGSEAPYNAGTTTNMQGNLMLLLCSSDEYRAVYERVVQKLPPSARQRIYSPATFKSIVQSKDRHTAAAFRASIRSFILTASGLKLVNVVLKLLGRPVSGPIFTDDETISRAGTQERFYKSPQFRLPLSLSLIILFHRLSYRFLLRLRASLRTEDARPFRERNPRVAKILTSKYAPAIGGSLAGFLLGLYPQSQLRLTAAIYAASRALESVYNTLVEEGHIKNRPWWFGSWLLMPLSMAQLFHAFIFDREATPKWFGDFILKFTPEYIQQRPSGFPLGSNWPEPHVTVDALAKIAELRWPPFTSPILHPNMPCTLPASIQSISPITSPAHPATASLSCALLHPKSPSCLTAFLHQMLLSLPPLTRTLTKVFLALSLFNVKSLIFRPITFTNVLCRKILAATAVFCSSIGAAWGSVCLFNTALPRSLLATKRFYLSGALAGLPFALLNGASHRSHFLYIFRQAVESGWKVGVKRGFWRGYRGGDLCVLVASWALMGVLLERRPAAVGDATLRKGLGWMKGDGYADPVEVRTKKKGKKAATQ
ncbi:hypothetical protein FQN57_007534 [Myotisia sp. PD_48]|nr:hypothetical protein FQN57_007534 [Myotisia sp. PD_48]